MDVLTAKEILADFEDNVEICYQDKDNINRYIPIHGFEVKHRRDGKTILVLTTTKILPNEYNG
jgi:hypothetical protein